MRDRLTKRVGVVEEVKVGGWRVVRFSSHEETSLRRSGNLAYLEKSATPSPDLVTLSAQLGGSKGPREDEENNEDLYVRSFSPDKEEDETFSLKKEQPLVKAARPIAPMPYSFMCAYPDPKKKAQRKAPREINLFPNLEPSVWKIVVCKLTNCLGVVTQVKCSGWRVVRTLDGEDLTRRPTQLAYAAPSEAAQFQPLVAELQRQANEHFLQQKKTFFQEQHHHVVEPEVRPVSPPLAVSPRKNSPQQDYASYSGGVQSVPPRPPVLTPQLETTQHFFKRKTFAYADEDDDLVVRLQFDDGTYTEEPWPQKVPEPNLVGRRVRTHDDKVASILGFAKTADRDAALLLVQFQKKHLPPPRPTKKHRNLQ